MPILVITNGSDAATIISDALIAHGFTVKTAPEFPWRKDRKLPDPAALVVLDASGAEQRGANKLRDIRLQSSIPVLVIIATNTPDVRSAWLEAGADDCLGLPIHVREVLARLRSILRRDAGESSRHILAREGISLNLATREAHVSGQPIDLTTVEFDVLTVLMRAAGRPVSRDQLMETLHKRKATAFDRSIDMHISHLRKKIGPDKQALIKTVRGAGYQFCPGLAVPQNAAAAATGS